MTGPAPRHDHQTIDQWAQQGLVNSQGRTSPESDVPEVPDSGGLEPAKIPTDPGAPPTAGPGTTPPDAMPQAGPTQVGDGRTDEDAATAAGKPGAVATPGDVAETAAFEGDGAYSEGRAASGPPAH